MPFIKLRPLIDQGVDLRTPAYQRKWSALNDTIFRQGRIRSRPGLHTVTGVVEKDLIAQGPAVALLEHSGRLHTAQYDIQTIVPTGTTSNDWDLNNAATAHAALADTDDTSYLNTTALNDSFEVTFGNTSGTVEAVEGILIRARARNGDDLNHVSTLLEFYLTAGSGASEALAFDYVVSLSASEGDGTDDWEDIYYWLDLNPSFTADTRWTQAHVDDLSIRVEFAEADSNVSTIFTPSANGGLTEWDSDSDTWQNVKSLFRFDSDDAATVHDTSISTTSAAKQSVTFSGGDVASMDSINEVTVRYYVGRDSGRTVRLQPFFRQSSTVVDIGDEFDVFPKFDIPTTFDQYRGTHRVEITLTENPRTSSAWTASDFSGGIEFGLENVVDGGGASWYYATVEVLGTFEPPVEVSTLHVDVLSLNTTNGQIPVSHILIGSRTQELVTSSAYGDISGSVSTWSGPPPVKASSGALNGTLYVTNGLNQIISYPQSASDAFEQLSGEPVGRCMEAWGGRIFLGDVVESSARVPHRLRWSAIADPTDWSGATAGDLPINDTEGPIVEIKKLLADLAIYKNEGIYVASLTGDVHQPVRHFLRDPHTGCVAKATVQSAVLDGVPVHLFLGEGTNGLNVFAFDGTGVTPMGTQIAEEILRDHNQFQIHNAFAVVDPFTDHYLLFYATEGEPWPSQCWALDLKDKSWRLWTFEQSLTAAGVWTVSGLYDGSPEVHGEKHAVVADLTGFVYWFDPDRAVDDYTPGLPDVDNGWDGASLDISTGQAVPAQQNVLPIIETGEIVVGEGLEQAVGYKLHVWYRDQGPVVLTVATSQDGGVNFTDETSVMVGTSDADGSIGHVSIPFGGTSSNRLRLQLYSDVYLGPFHGKLDVEDLMIEYQVGGTR